MNKIIRKIQYSEKVYRFDVEAPLIAKSRKAGNFVIIRVDSNSERMPLTIADADIEKGTIALVVQKVGLSSTKLCNLHGGATRQSNPYRELRHGDLCRWRCRRGSDASDHEGVEGSRQPCAIRHCGPQQRLGHHGRRGAGFQRPTHHHDGRW